MAEARFRRRPVEEVLSARQIKRYRLKGCVVCDDIFALGQSQHKALLSPAGEVVGYYDEARREMRP